MPSPETPGGSQQLSCATCRRRKVRCDKKPEPCGPCARGGHACLYKAREPRMRRQPRTSINDVAARISELERTLKGSSPASSASRPAFTPSSEPVGHSPGREILLEKGSSSQYFNEVLVTRLIEKEHYARVALESPVNKPPCSPFNPMGIISKQSDATSVASFHPSKKVAMDLWKTYVYKVDSTFKAIHLPTTEVMVYTVINDPAAATMEHLALCFAMYYAAAIALDPEDGAVCPSLDEPWTTSLLRFKTGLEQALAHAEYVENPTVILIQAMTIYLTALRVHNGGRSVLILNGLNIYAARSIGLHRDGAKLGLSPFVSEMRRRLWWYLLGRDGRAGEDYGVSPAIVSYNCFFEGPHLPLNVDDTDLYPEMTELPAPRKGWTRMTTFLFQIALCKAWAQIQQVPHESPGPPSREARSQIIREMQTRSAELLRYCNPLIPEHQWTLLPARFVMRKLDFVSRRQWDAYHNPHEQEVLATDESLDEAIDLMHESQNFERDELMGPVLWQQRSYQQYHLYLFILWHVCVRPQGSRAREGYDMVADEMDATERRKRDLLRGPKWRILGALREKAGMILSGQEESDAEAASATQPVTPAQGQGMAAEFVDMGAAMPCYGALGVPDWSSLLDDFFQEDAPFPVMVG